MISSKVLSITLISILLLGGAFPSPAKPRFTPKNEKQQLRVRGQVLAARVSAVDKCCVRVHLKLGLEFFNGEGRPLILLSREPWIVGRTFAVSDENARGGRFIYSDYRLPSILRAPGNEWEQLERQLDQPAPPGRLTRLLAPGEVWKYEIDTWWTIERKKSFDGRSEGWDVIKQHAHVRLGLVFEMWPSNVEPRAGSAELKFGKKLKRRWRAAGELWLKHVTSEPIELNLETLKVGDG